MATKKSQRVFIWVIAVVMVLATVGMFAGMILSYENQDNLARQARKDYLDNIYSSNLPLEGYEAKSFDASKVKKLQKNDLKESDGQKAKLGDTIVVQYFGWLPNGKIFDSSRKANDATQSQKDSSGVTMELKKGRLIKGWIKGIPGMKVGGVRMLTIPSDLAYGERGSPISQNLYLIEPNTPLKFTIKLEGIKK